MSLVQPHHNPHKTIEMSAQSSSETKQPSASSSAPATTTPYKIFQPPVRKQLGPPVISIRELSKSYALPGREEPVHALSTINLCDDPQLSEFYSIRTGEFIMIRGPSGGGKTSLLNCIGLIDRPTTGSIQLMGKQVDLAVASDDELSRMRLEKIGFVFQTFNLLATFTALENVELPMTIQGKLSKKEMKKRAIKLLTMVGLEDRLDHIPSGKFIYIYIYIPSCYKHII